MPPVNQLSTREFIIRQSLPLLLLGAVWGIFVRPTPFPRLDLSANVEAIANAPIWLGIGAVLQTDFISVSHAVP
jgi:hypothetical protein